MTMTISEAISKTASWLQTKGVDSPRLDAELLLARILNCDRLRLYLDWQKPLTELEVTAYRELVRRRGQEREPVARILGSKAFYGRDILVTPDTFVPRPETEGLVERALMLLETEEALKGHHCTIFEIGTGTGCIITTIAAENGAHRFLASDVSPKALATARSNAHRLGVESRVEFREGPYLAGFDGSIHLLVSNPPYIETGVISALPPEVSKWDPMLALDGGLDGLDPVRVIAREGRDRLIQGGWILLELGEAQAKGAKEIFDEAGGYERFKVEKDLAGLDRYIFAMRSGA